MFTGAASMPVAMNRTTELNSPWLVRRFAVKNMVLKVKYTYLVYHINKRTVRLLNKCSSPQIMMVQGGGPLRLKMKSTPQGNDHAGRQTCRRIEQTFSGGRGCLAATIV